MNTLKKIVGYLFLAVVLLAVGFNLIMSYSDWLDGIFNPDPGTVIAIEDIPNGLGEQVNGELNPAQREAMKQDILRPAHEDIVRQFYLFETQSHVLVFRQVKESATRTIYPNLSFLKASNGLIWDGTWGIDVLVPLNRFTGVHDFNNATVTYDVRLFEDAKIANTSVFSMSNFSSKFAKSPDIFSPTDYHSYAWAWQHIDGHSARENVRLFDFTRDWVRQNVVNKYFENMTDIIGVDNRALKPGKTPYNLYDSLELKMEGAVGKERENITFSMLGSIATHLWEQTKDLPSPQTAIVDISSWFDLYIAANSRANYPIGASELVLYSGELTNYAMYNCGVYANVGYTRQNFNTFIVPPEKTTKYLTDNLAKNDYSFEPLPVVTDALTVVRVKLTNSNNSDISLFDITQKNVLVTVADRPILFATAAELASGKTIVLAQNALYAYTISSTNGGLVFAATSGTFEIAAVRNSELTLPYTYNHGFVYATMRLLPTGSIDLSTTNFATDPVYIVLNSTTDSSTYTFAFTTLQKVIGNGEQLLVKNGNYNYTINSTALLFSAPNGQITINEHSRLFSFTYSLTFAPGDVSFADNFAFTTNSFPNNQNYQAGRIYFSYVHNAGSTVNQTFGSDHVIKFEIFHASTNQLLYSTPWRTYEYMQLYPFTNLQYTQAALGNGNEFKARAAVQTADGSVVSYSPVVNFFHNHNGSNYTLLSLTGK